MILRSWRGATSVDDAEAYLVYLRGTGLAAYRATPGNAGAWVLGRARGDRWEILVLSAWESMEAVRRFAGPEPEKAVFYPEDDRFLVQADETVEHWEWASPHPSESSAADRPPLAAVSNRTALTTIAPTSSGSDCWSRGTSALR